MHHGTPAARAKRARRKGVDGVRVAQTPHVREQAQKRRHFGLFIIAVHVRPAQLGVHVALRRRDVQVAHHNDLRAPGRPPAMSEFRRGARAAGAPLGGRPASTHYDS